MRIFRPTTYFYRTLLCRQRWLLQKSFQTKKTCILQMFLCCLQQQITYEIGNKPARYTALTNIFLYVIQFILSHSSVKSQSQASSTFISTRHLVMIIASARVRRFLAMLLQFLSGGEFAVKVAP